MLLLGWVGGLPEAFSDGVLIKKPAHIHACEPSDIHTYVHTHVRLLFPYTDTSLHTYITTYISTFKRLHIRSCIHAHVYTYTHRLRQSYTPKVEQHTLQAFYKLDLFPSFSKPQQARFPCPASFFSGSPAKPDLPAPAYAGPDAEIKNSGKEALQARKAR